MSDPLLIRAADGILQIRFNRPRRKNALTMDMYARISDTIEQAENDPSVRVIVFLGSAGNFTSGNDISGPPPHPMPGELSPPLRFIMSLVRSTLPVIAGVDGVAVGIGATMLLHLDAVIVTPRAHLLLPFVNLALVPEAGSSMILPRLLGYTRAADLLLGGRPIDGRRACELGLATQIVEAEALTETVLATAGDMAKLPANSVRQTKRLLKGDIEPLLERMRAEERLLFDCAASAEHQEALAALAEKRPPDFTRMPG